MNENYKKYYNKNQPLYFKLIIHNRFDFCVIYGKFILLF